MNALGLAFCAAVLLAGGAAAAVRWRAACADAPATAEEAECLAFLERNLPARDRGVVSRGLLLRHARLALAARRATPWAAAVPWEIFLNDVLPHRQLDEPIDIEWRPLFAQRFAPLVAGAASLADAAQALNAGIWAACGGIHFVPDKSPEIMSPGQVLAAGYASCTGLSIFLADACRAFGIPARVAGTPSWLVDRRDGPHERFNNHNWVEVWNDGAWSFTGAAEFDARGFNRTWFFPQPAKGQRPGDTWHAIYAASYRRTGTPFPLAWAPRDRSVWGVDVTQAYLDTPPPPSGGTEADGAGAGAAGGGAVAAAR
ncbi:hypothetical protein HT031_000956 [Scenedesmus sp. PABB004]|nr:hypothetical protein HT031_000956 [Scenedesmus sp. PABB004]